MGRSYQLIATGSRDKMVKLWALRLGSADGSDHDDWASGGVMDGADSGERRWAVNCCAELAHRSQVWRVGWNPSGSMLAASEDDGQVSVYKMDAAGGWRRAVPVPLS
jgi:nucleoporin SEH1